jgi:hypothetical protein
VMSILWLKASSVRLTVFASPAADLSGVPIAKVRCQPYYLLPETILGMFLSDDEFGF